MPAGGAIKPVSAMPALLFRQPLFAFALRALSIHLMIFNVIGKQQPAFRTLFEVSFPYLIGAIRRRAQKNRLTSLAKILPFILFLANWTLFHRDLSHTQFIAESDLMRC